MKQSLDYKIQQFPEQQVQERKRIFCFCSSCQTVVVVCRCCLLLFRLLLLLFLVVVMVVVLVEVVVLAIVFNVLRSFPVLVPKCPALTVGYLVKTSPNSCVTSQMKTNTTCSFSCPLGYQLKGPSYKQCKANGSWTDSAKTVSCSGGL